MQGKDDFQIISKQRGIQSKGPKKNVKNGKLKRTKRSREGESERQNLSGRLKSFVRASQAIIKLSFGNSTTSEILDRYAKFRIVLNL